MSLYPYQWEGVEFLRENRRAYLADEMGLGKTVQSVVAARFEQVERPITVAPASTIPNWRREIHKWWPQHPNWPIISYSRLIQPRWQRRFEEYGWEWDLVVLDEAHYAKNPEAKRTEAALRLAASADRAWLLSGTPMPNDPTELWPPVVALWTDVALRHRCRDIDDWRDRFCYWEESKYGPRVWGARDADSLRHELGKFMLRRRVRDVLPDLPPLRVHVHYMKKDVGDWNEMAEHLRELGVSLPGIESLEDVPNLPPEHMATLRRFLGAYKAPRVVRLLYEELQDGAYEKIVILAHHRDTLEILKRELHPWGVVGFDGSTPETRRQKAIDAFNLDPEARVFVGQQTAAGTGINLQAASEIALLEPAWSPEYNQQAIKRIHRIGQDSPCRARMFAVDGTLDALLMQRLAEKTQIIQEVLE